MGQLAFYSVPTKPLKLDPSPYLKYVSFPVNFLVSAGFSWYLASSNFGLVVISYSFLRLFCLPFILFYPSLVYLVFF